MITLPEVTDDFDGQCAAIDAAIRAAAAGFSFRYTVLAPTIDHNAPIPVVIYRIISNYSDRGFFCVYDGQAGTLTIDWSHPNMTPQEFMSVQRATPQMIPLLGIAFRASLVYLCMTNGEDLRSHTNYSVQRQLEHDIGVAASLGNKSVMFGFPCVPAPVVQRLFSETFELLESSGFIVRYNMNSNLFEVIWGDTLPVNLKSGSHGQVVIS